MLKYRERQQFLLLYKEILRVKIVNKKHQFR